MFDEREGGEKKGGREIAFFRSWEIKTPSTLSLSLSRYSWLDWKRETRPRDFEYPFFSCFFFFDIQFPQPDQRHLLKVEQASFIWVK